MSNIAILTEEQLSRFEDQEDIDIVLSLKAEDVTLIDNWLLSFASDRYQKVAMLVIKSVTKCNQENILTNVPDVFYGIRVEALVENHQLQGEGDLSNMRHSEVRSQREISQ